MTSDEEMVDKPSPEQQRNMNRDDQVDKITSESSDSSDSSTEDTDIATENSTECWITCYGKLRHLTSTVGECQELLSTADNADAPNHLLGDLVDIVQRINVQSSSLLKMAVNELTKLDDVPYEEKSNNRDPAKRRNIMSDADRIFLIEQGPLQPKLTRYPRNPNIKDKKKQCRFSSEWFKQYPYLEYSLHTDKAYCFVCQLFPQCLD